MIDRKVIKTNPQGKPVTVVTKSGPTGYEIEKINQKNGQCASIFLSSGEIEKLIEFYNETKGTAD